MKVFKTSVLFAALILFVACTQTQTKDDYTVVWEENFEDSTKLENNWSKIPRGSSDWDNYMSDYDGLYAVKNGNLVLRGIKNTVLPDDSVPYLTGGVFTKDKRVFGHGRIEIRAKLFGARSAWPAFWMLPDNAKYPEGGEIDIMERLNMDNYVYQTVHSAYTLKHGITDNPTSGITAQINPDNYNVYAVELFADSLSFFINDTHTFTYPRIETDLSGQFPFGDEKYYLLLDMQLGGSWVGPVNEQDLPAEMHIDWVRYLTKEK
ncbi:MAG TPA: glycoside hydrolase family 16 protein [Dysgonamonadaceae bacterium]|nr:glycoside hydrolase family 16 protein [Dysgonamonadaceae bacterium]